MEQTQKNAQPEAENAAPAQEGYVPRPAWQVWGARIAAVIFILLVIAQIIHIARGGL